MVDEILLNYKWFWLIFHIILYFWLFRILFRHVLFLILKFTFDKNVFHHKLSHSRNCKIKIFISRPNLSTARKSNLRPGHLLIMPILSLSSFWRQHVATFHASYACDLSLPNPFLPGSVQYRLVPANPHSGHQAKLTRQKCRSKQKSTTSFAVWGDSAVWLVRHAWNCTIKNNWPNKAEITYAEQSYENSGGERFAHFIF